TYLPHFCDKNKTYLPQIKKYAVITFIYHRNYAVNIKLIHRISIKKQSMQFGNFTIQFGNRTLLHLQR
ncbi:hypothetical protein, partial [Flavobacterium franklandianum]|uniref:hypothetical protein n=1 Tax=Flavobacterium franklandianum TaxID=2594430 RepID=UPI001C3FF4EC